MRAAAWRRSLVFVGRPASAAIDNVVREAVRRFRGITPQRRGAVFMSVPGRTAETRVDAPGKQVFSVPNCVGY